MGEDGVSGVLDRYVVFTGEDEGVVSVATSVSMGGGTTSVTAAVEGAVLLE